MRALHFSLGLSMTLGLLAAGCAADTTTEDAPSFEQAKSSLSRDTAPNATAAEMASLAEGNAELTMRLYGQTAAKGEGNAFFSPLSVVSALSMTYAGARGTTATEMAAGLSFKLPEARLHVAMNALDLALTSRASDASSEGKPFTLRSVNTTFGQKGVPFEAPYLDTIATNYGAGVQLADFKNQADAERTKINAWVEKQTEQKIQNLLGPGSLNEATRMVLVNAVYFNADWAMPFDKDQTRDASFTNLDGSKSNVPTMNQTAPMKYADTETAQVVEMPYQGNKVSMVVVLPRQGLKTFETAFDGKALLSTMAGLTTEKRVRISLPKFSIAGEAISLRKPLEALGMSAPFSAKDADFSGMVKPEAERLFISDVLHKAFVRVDEKGTEAAAATAVIMAGTASIPEEPVVFEVNRPFMVFIRDIPTNTVLFAGRIAAPK